MRDSEGKGYIKEGIDGREMGWRQLQMCGYSFTLRQTLSLSLSLSPLFLLLSGLCFNLFCLLWRNGNQV